MAEGRVLLVDDDRLVLATLGDGLRRAGMTVLEADSGHQAIDCLGDNEVDLAVIDVRMPGMSGLSLAGWLAEHTALPFIFLSAYEDPETVSEAIRYGALTYLVKPLQSNQLVPVLNAAMARGRELHQLREHRDQLERAVQGSRSVSVAVGLVMERAGIGRSEAFNRLRGHARDQRRRLEEVAEEYIEASELFLGVCRN
ncbi:putative transcriptional regulatory protein pdtaR [wastewater metagenome]|uniref:Putative transcriptional regulatory protein pdtaR n=2 Tax=unclassified sequences TaxID=12908 RepID=A0A5B8RC19_9ZZZZ|nr:MULTISPECIES: response regulator [Arhodomonas]MCS4502966.1 response regulator [Arhodomonas aquaeolei]QEA06196.1 putative transcriptional regulatory protein pdtaR [uncultured organism]